MAPGVVIDLRMSGLEEHGVIEVRALGRQLGQVPLFGGELSTGVVKLLGGLLRSSQGVGGGFHSLPIQPRRQAFWTSGEEAFAQGDCDAARCVRLQVLRVHRNDDDVIEKGALRTGGLRERSRASAEGLQGMAFARSRGAEKANGERRLRLVVHGEVGQQVEGGVLAQGGGARRVGMKQGRGRIGEAWPLEGRRHLIQATSPCRFPRRPKTGVENQPQEYDG